MLPKGTLTVIMATIIASSSILIFGNTVADSTEKKSIDPLLISSGVVSSESNRDDVVNTNVDVGGTTNNAVLVSPPPPPPPPGPFFSEESIGIGAVSISESMSQIRVKASEIASSTVPKPVAPSFERGQPEQTVSTLEPEFKKMQPSMPSEPVTLTINPGDKLKKIASPVQKDVSPNKPAEPVSLVQVPARSQDIIEEKSEFKINKMEPKGPSAPKKKVKELIVKKAVIDKVIPSEPIWMMLPPISPMLQLSQPMARYQTRQAPTQIIPNNMNFPPRMNQQYIYVPMPANRSGFTYPSMPMMNSGYYNYGPKFGMPQTPIGINTQMKTLDSRELNNTEIK